MMRWTEGIYREVQFSVGNWHLSILSTEPVELPFQSSILTQNAELPKMNVTVWYHPDRKGQFKRQFRECTQSARTIIPPAIDAFYRGLETCGVAFLPPRQHCNRYYLVGTWILAEFPYVTDDFFMACDCEQKAVYLFGKETALNRILMDLQSISLSILPLHGSAAEKDGNAVCVLGNSNSGKTFALQVLLHHGFSFLADDEIYIQGNTIYLINPTLSLRHGNSKQLLQLNYNQIRTCQQAQIDKIWVLQDLQGREYLQWFPCVAKQSFWWYLFLDFTPELERYLIEKIDISVQYVRNLIQQGKTARLNLAEATLQLKVAPFDPEKLFSL